VEQSRYVAQMIEEEEDGNLTFSVTENTTERADHEYVNAEMYERVVWGCGQGTRGKKPESERKEKK